MESEARLTIEKISGKRKEQKRRKVDELEAGSESHLEDGASVPSLKRRRKEENLETRRREAKDGTGTEIIKTGIPECNMTGILTDERRYGNSNTKEWNDKNFKRRSK